MTTEIATLGGGCFWCLEAVYQEMRGILEIESGYSGGHTAHPDYESVCSGQTGHAEVVRIQFDTKQTSYRELLEVFFTIHDPTTLNRQGNDVGTQYRSVIYTHSTEQANIAHKVIAEMAHVWDASIVTEVQEAPEFHPAEHYHQNYYVNHPMQSYCAFVVAPKVAKFRKVFTDKLRKK
jgi:peptide-methionine (S)-S-oxide reductase